MTVTSPTAGQTFQRRSSVSAAASVTDNVKVSDVKFMLDGSVICVTTQTPYLCQISLKNRRSWNGTVQVTATDSTGNVTTRAVAISVP